MESRDDRQPVGTRATIFQSLGDRSDNNPRSCSSTSMVSSACSALRRRSTSCRAPCTGSTALPTAYPTTRGERLGRLSDRFELVWATGWEERANEHLPFLLGMPRGDLPCLLFDGRAVFGSAHWKLDAIDEYAGCAAGRRSTSPDVGRQWRESAASSWSSAPPSSPDCPPTRTAARRATSRRERAADDPRLPPRRPQGGHLLPVPDARRPHAVQPARSVDLLGRGGPGVPEQGLRLPEVHHAAALGDDVQGPTEALSAFVASNPAGTPSDRRMLCLRVGDQNIGQVRTGSRPGRATSRGEADAPASRPRCSAT